MWQGVGLFIRTLFGISLTIPLALKVALEWTKYSTTKKIAELLAKEKDKE